MSKSLVFIFLQNIKDSDTEKGSQPLNPITKSRVIGGYGNPLANLPMAKHWAEYNATAAPMPKPPMPSFTSGGSDDK